MKQADATPMTPTTPADTLSDLLFRAAARYGDRPLFAVPANAARGYLPQGLELSHAAVADEVRHLSALYAGAGYGVGHRVALLLENRPAHVLHRLALNALGVCCVPVNPDYRAGETAYLIDHAKVALVLVLPERLAQLEEALAVSTHQPRVLVLDEVATACPPAAQRADQRSPTPDTPASVLYTSGTTGRPKGCVLSHRYEIAAGLAYLDRGGLAAVREAEDRLYNPLPLFHVNAGILSFWAMVISGGCQIQTDRFAPARWWNEVRDSRASIVHYLGVVVPMLLNQPEALQDRDHAVRFGFGAGAEPQLHAAFEQRFGFPLIELWGMTEMVRILTDNHEPRQVGTRAFGRAVPGVEVRVVDDNGAPSPDDRSGELLIRHSAATPRQDFFSGYLDDPEATESAWQGGWFHTGDVVRRDVTGMLHFVDRRKNIIRRSGENIAAAEVEACLLAHPWVLNVAVMAVPDEVREEEVLACVVLAPAGAPDAHGLPRPADEQAAADALFRYGDAVMAYYKVPGWWWFTPEIPTTGTQKIQKHRIFAPGTDPRQQAGMLDLRARKKQRR